MRGSLATSVTVLTRPRWGELTLSSIGGGLLETLYTPSALSVSGPLTLILKGTSGANASYSGTLNVTAVPEPESIALMLVGPGVLGFVAHRRRSA